MILYDSAMAPNPRRVRIFLAEKGIEIPIEQVNIATAENREPPFRAKNSLGTLPVLELDDGTFLTESVAICRYFEGTHPDPPLMGVDARDAAFVEMWNRRMELEVLSNVAGAFRNTHDFFAGRIRQVPEYGEACKANAFERLDWLEEELGERQFIDRLRGCGGHQVVAGAEEPLALARQRIGAA
jgi:glutathione S-transferase